MRLINITTHKLTEFVDPPPYAILSHRWTGEETTFDAFQADHETKSPGIRKILEFCEFVQRRADVEWVWVDTCCIDKRSSAELSEAINSMWNWYWNSQYCVVYLPDVTSENDVEAAVERSEWFKRGWTLQELLAPSQIILCNSKWSDLGKDLDLIPLLAKGSGVQAICLRDRNKIFQASVARRMSWAAGRKTTRTEDIAYCLFGLFEINLPLLYGEGDRAFMRLQREIINQSDDESILAWSLPQNRMCTIEDCIQMTGILAPHPSHFWQSADIQRLNFVERKDFVVDKNLLIIDSSLIQVQSKIFLLKLNCGIVRPIRTLQESQMWFEECVLVDWSRETANYPSFQSRGCLVPLVLDSNGIWRRIHINSTNRHEMKSWYNKTFETRRMLDNFESQIILEIWTDRPFTTIVSDHEVHRIAIAGARSARSAIESYHQVHVLDAEHFDALWNDEGDESWYTTFARQNVQERMSSPEVGSSDASDMAHVAKGKNENGLSVKAPVTEQSSTYASGSGLLASPKTYNQPEAKPRWLEQRSMDVSSMPSLSQGYISKSLPSSWGRKRDFSHMSEQEKDFTKRRNLISKTQAESHAKETAVSDKPRELVVPSFLVHEPDSE